ncbi:unnamed protein product [Musa textilis]
MFDPNFRYAIPINFGLLSYRLLVGDIKETAIDRCAAPLPTSLCSAVGVAGDRIAATRLLIGRTRAATPCGTRSHRRQSRAAAARALAAREQAAQATVARALAARAQAAPTAIARAQAAPAAAARAQAAVRVTAAITAAGCFGGTRA